MNILDVLKSNFDCLDPIFDYEIYKLGYTDKDISDTLQKNVFEEIIPDKSFNIKSRVFNLVAYSEILDQYVPIDGKSEQLVIGYYIGRNNEYGYPDFLNLYNKLGLSTQVPFTTYIASTRVDSDTEFGRYKIRKLEGYDKSMLPYIYLSTVLNFKYEIEYPLDDIYRKLSTGVTDLDTLLKFTDDKEKAYEFFAQYKWFC